MNGARKAWQFSTSAVLRALRLTERDCGDCAQKAPAIFSFRLHGVRRNKFRLTAFSLAPKTDV